MLTSLMISSMSSIEGCFEVGALKIDFMASKRHVSRYPSENAARLTAFCATSPRYLVCLDPEHELLECEILQMLFIII
jgi:hypothetical protein